MSTIKPTYYVRHPDATYSVADPQPTIQHVKQEPVAWLPTRKWIYDKLSELGASITSSCCGVPDKRCGADEWILQTVQIELLLDALPAPVRTKDLTDDEIDAFIDRAWDKQMSMPEIIRAVIAADRELNK